jgi:hypothetical protein
LYIEISDIQIVTNKKTRAMKVEFIKETLKSKGFSIEWEDESLFYNCIATNGSVEIEISYLVKAGTKARLAFRSGSTDDVFYISRDVVNRMFEAHGRDLYKLSDYIDKR